MSEFEKIIDDFNRDKQLNEARSPIFTSEIIQKLSQLPGLKKLGSWFISNGSVALFRNEEDGNAYEISVVPISKGNYSNLWGNLIKKREDRA